MSQLNKDGDSVYIDPILITAYDLSRGEEYIKYIGDPDNSYPIERTNMFDNNRPFRVASLKKFFSKFIHPSYHGYVFYAHNLSSFDGMFILESLRLLCEEQDYKIFPIIRDNKLISIKIKYGLDKKRNRYRYYIEFHDSLLILLSSLEKLSKLFMKDSPEFQKINDKLLIDALLYKDIRDRLKSAELKEKLETYCLRDSVALSHIINSFSLFIFEKFNLNIHRYPTASSLGLAIFLTHCLKIDTLIPLLTGEIYRDISKAYHGGLTEVYKLYSDQDVHSYDFVSMYPAQMYNEKFPCGKITKFIGNPIDVGETLETLKEQLAFIKCSVYVDKSLTTPVYKTKVLIDGVERSVCATGTFHNQWVFVPELVKYSELTQNKTRILLDTIQEGYLFEKQVKLFKKYISLLFDLKQSVTKDDPRYLISKILMNSLYGRMGLRQELTEYTFMNNRDIEKWAMNYKYEISDIIELSSSEQSLVITQKDSDEVKLKSSVAIAAAITAYARMSMAPIILDESLDILYIDTDSYKCTEKITELPKYKHLDHNGLGGLQYEGTYSESLYLLPKVYGGIYKESGSEFTKVKGFKDKVEFNQLKEMLFKNQELKLSQNKWHRDMLKSEIKIMKSPYLLSLNENKRRIDLQTLTTKPYHFESYDPETK